MNDLTLPNIMFSRTSGLLEDIWVRPIPGKKDFSYFSSIVTASLYFTDNILEINKFGKTSKQGMRVQTGTDWRNSGGLIAFRKTVSEMGKERSWQGGRAGWTPGREQQRVLQVIAGLSGQLWGGWHMLQGRCRDAAVTLGGVGLGCNGDRNACGGMLGEERLRCRWITPDTSQRGPCLPLKSGQAESCCSSRTKGLCLGSRGSPTASLSVGAGSAGGQRGCTQTDSVHTGTCQPDAQSWILPLWTFANYNISCASIVPLTCLNTFLWE